MALDKRTSAMLELTFASTFWGFGFIAAAWALRAMGPLAVTGWRFFLAASVGSFFLFVIRREKFEKDQFWLAAVPGLLLSATLILGAVWLDVDKATTNYRWGGAQCGNRDLSESSVQLLFASFRSEYNVTLEYVVTTVKDKQYRCITGFSISKT